MEKNPTARNRAQNPSKRRSIRMEIKIWKIICTVPRLQKQSSSKHRKCGTSEWRRTQGKDQESQTKE